MYQIESTAGDTATADTIRDAETAARTFVEVDGADKAAIYHAAASPADRYPISTATRCPHNPRRAVLHY